MFKIRNIFLSLILFALTSCNGLKNLLYKKFVELQKAKTEYRVEIPYEVENGFIFLNLKVNGKCCRFLFDTGSKSYIKKNISDSLGMIFHSQTNSKDIFGVEKQSEKVIGKLEIGNFLINTFYFTTKDNFKLNCQEIDGVLGNEILNQGTFYFDSEARKIIISDKIDKNLETDNFQKVPIKSFLGDIIVKIKREKYILDSGFSNGFISTNLDSKLFNKESKSKSINRQIEGLNSSKQIWITFQYINISFEKTNQKGLVGFSNDISTNLLGSEWFLMNDLIIDVNNKNLFIKPNNNLTPTNLNQVCNISFGIINNTVCVSGISKDLDFCQINDQILKINNQTLETIKSKCQLMELLKTIDFKEGLTLEILTEGTVKIIYFSYQYLY
jgi:hypothetical protein